MYVYVYVIYTCTVNLFSHSMLMKNATSLPHPLPWSLLRYHALKAPSTRSHPGQKSRVTFVWPLSMISTLALRKLKATSRRSMMVRIHYWTYYVYLVTFLRWIVKLSIMELYGKGTIFLWTVNLCNNLPPPPPCTHTHTHTHTHTDPAKLECRGPCSKYAISIPEGDFIGKLELTIEGDPFKVC